ncbi:MAG: ribonuclease HI [Bacteroidales bacterium]|nr:ribonuclease HI [Bacteroidales bacterium]
MNIIDIYTDGSCNPQYKIGGWAAIIFINDKKIVLQDIATETTHNRMELKAVINAIEYVLKEIQEFKLIRIYTDSQYVERIPFRTEKLLSKDFITKGGNSLQNSDLIKKLIHLIDCANIEFIKVKAHQKVSETPNYNREVDKLSRKLVRQQINKK